MNLARVTEKAAALLRRRDSEMRQFEEAARALGHTPSHESRGAVLAILPAGPDAERLRHIVDSMGWELRFADSCFDAVQLMEHCSFPIVLYDRHLASPDWAAALKILRAAHHPACLILTSTVLDGFLWEEVIQQGGFDVLPRPFDEVQVCRTLKFALSHWKSGWMRRSWDNFAW